MTIKQFRCRGLDGHKEDSRVAHHIQFDLSEMPSWIADYVLQLLLDNSYYQQAYREGGRPSMIGWNIVVTKEHTFSLQ